MELTISGRHLEVTEAMQSHIRQHLQKLHRYNDQIQAVSVTLHRDAGSEEAEVRAKCRKSLLVATARSHDMYRSIEQAFERLERQVARLHEKLVSRSKPHRGGGPQEEQAP